MIATPVEKQSINQGDSMKTNYKAAIALVAVAVGATIVGAVGGTFLHAQTAVTPAYIIAEVQVTTATTERKNSARSEVRR